MIIKNRHLVDVKKNDIQHDTIIIPNDVKIINGKIFTDLPITKIVLSQSVSFVYSKAFYHCTTLKSVIFTNPNCILNNGVFDRCERLESIILPLHLKVLPIYTFQDCKNLKEILIPDSVRELTLEQFLNCEKLQKIQWRGHVYSYTDLQTYRRF